MDYKRQSGRRWIQKMIVFFGFSLFTARAEAQIILGTPPSITLQPVGLSVQNGGTAVLIADATALLDPITSVTWYQKNSSGQISQVPANEVVTVNVVGLTVASTLTVPNVTSATGGSYYIVAQNSLGTATSSSATVIILANTVSNVLNVVHAVIGASKMLPSGFKVEFSAPTGSNLVIEATSSIKMNNWSALCTNLVSGGSVTYTDAVAKTSSCRFYRARLK